MHLMKVGILHAVEMAQDLFCSFFRAVNAPFDFQVYDITKGDFPESPGTCDAFVISGSVKGVYDADPWIHELSEFIEKSQRERRKLVGICFGHQIIAHALGGYASKSKKGWGLGLREFQITTKKSWMDPALDHCTLYFAHQDQVTELPAGAEVLGGNDFCPNAVYCIGDRVLGIQGHPEFSRRFMHKILELLKEKAGLAVHSDALKSLGNGEPDAKTVAHWIINFIQMKE